MARTVLFALSASVTLVQSVAPPDLQHLKLPEWIDHLLKVHPWVSTLVMILSSLGIFKVFWGPILKWLLGEGSGALVAITLAIVSYTKALASRYAKAHLPFVLTSQSMSPEFTYR